ncbi:hypothetical protein GPECTOR_45g122 [Gonium pectorale]|uniref:Uncharacterized protein n=1 Tax=Gonium pectorale TaxID=33097 RepID=A0A150G8S8_GONPE|nr:hypothetical protein GPECTOR_45g122 [Gonium pectorale]|eukprot:KXZ46252.1 hypothetical protein GPECTOR_45g122 [Gonium pectorale]
MERLSPDEDEDVHGVIEVDDAHGSSSDEDDAKVASTSGEHFGKSQVFVVRAISKASTGYRPSVTCDGFLADVIVTHSGYILSPLGSNQQLSFKYEPPSPKFSRKRPGSISYRLQLLQGSQFLYSLRGLPRTLRCQRRARALEWGPIHVVFASEADLDTFLATIKYVQAEEVAGEQEAQAQARVELTRRLSAGNWNPGGAEGPGVVWPAAAAELWLDSGAAGPSGGSGRAGPGPPGALGELLRPLRGRELRLPLLGPTPLPLLVASAGVAALAALTGAVLLASRSRRGAGR